MRYQCCVCHTETQKPDAKCVPGGDPNDVSHGYCKSCRTWSHEFGKRQLAGDSTATREEFERQVEVRRALYHGTRTWIK